MSRTLACLFAICGLFFFAPAAKAEEMDWTGIQIQGTVGGEATLTDRVAMRGSIHYFKVMQTDMEFFLTYAGPKFTVTDWFWTAPQFGSVSGWFDGGDDGLVLSLWNGLTFGDFTAFLEVDRYFSPSNGPRLYGYCSLDANSGGTVPANFGLQIEEIETDFVFGPHLGFTKDSAHFEAQYYLSATPDMFQTHAARLIAAVIY